MLGDFFFSLYLIPAAGVASFATLVIFTSRDFLYDQITFHRGSEIIPASR
jgi:hypothetical protein